MQVQYNYVNIAWSYEVINKLYHEGNKMRHGQKFFDCHRKK